MKFGDWKNAGTGIPKAKEKVAPSKGMIIRWGNVYYPHGEWINDSGDKVDITSGFRATYGDINLIVMMHYATSAPSHGEPSMTALWPSYIDEDNLEYVSVDGNSIVIK